MKLKILFVSTEVHPFAKTGGLADVSGALPPALKKLGHDIRVIIPKYPCTSKAGKGMQPLKVDLDIPGFNQKGTLFQSELTDSVPVYLIEHDDYYNREHICGEPGSDYPDSLERFAFFCRAVLETAKKLDFKPDIIHCNDWHTGTGLGLSICQKIIENHRGTIRVENQMGKGVIVYLHLPLQKKPDYYKN